MNINELFPSRFLSAADLHGKRVTVTIERLALEEVRDAQTGEMKRKPAVYFAKASKPMLLNKTNAVSISKATGHTDTEAWVGKRITLYPTTVKAFGAIHEVVRVVEAPTSNGKPPAAEDEPHY